MKVRVGRRFTLTIPKEIREALRIKEGNELEVSVVSDALVLRKVKGLVELIDSLEPRGRVEAFLEVRLRSWM